MGDPDNKEELDLWLLCLPRFSSRQAIPFSLISLLESDFNFYQLNDRNQYFKDTNYKDNVVEIIPHKIKADLVDRFLFNDMKKSFQRFFGSISCIGGGVDVDLFYYIT